LLDLSREGLVLVPLGLIDNGSNVSLDSELLKHRLLFVAVDERERNWVILELLEERQVLISESVALALQEQD